MCKKSKTEAKILKDRTKGLDSRGNCAVNTQAESAWATETLKSLSTNQEAVDIIKADLERVYSESKKLDGARQLMCKKFQKGYEEFFGKKATKKGEQDVPPKAVMQPQDLINLMLESQYDFKEAADMVANSQKDKNAETKKMYKQGRGDLPEFKDRGRVVGRERRNSFVGPHAGITDHVFRQEETENLFSREVVHAKGMLEGDPTSKTYQRFVEQGAPFIGGVSGTMQGLSMGWEVQKPLSSFDEDEVEEEVERREKTAGIYMATLLAGGHHSASEMLYAAQQHGLFKDVPNPLENYPGAMKGLGDRFTELGLPGGLSPKAGETWRKALVKVKADVVRVEQEITQLFRGNDFADEAIAAFDDEVKKKFNALFDNALADKLDEIVSLVAEKDKQKRFDAIGNAKGLIAEARHKLDSKVVQGLDDNPFIAVSVRQTIESALDQVASLAR